MKNLAFQSLLSTSLPYVFELGCERVNRASKNRAQGAKFGGTYFRILTVVRSFCCLLPLDSSRCFPRQLFAKLQAVRAEIADQQEAHIRERQELEQAQEDLTRELKLK